MTTDQRLDRIERILIPYFNVGRRERKHVREVDDKISILINAQIKNEDGFRQLKERFDQTDRSNAGNRPANTRNGSQMERNRS